MKFYEKIFACVEFDQEDVSMRDGPIPGGPFRGTDYLRSVCEPFPRQFVLYFVDLK